MTNPTLKINFEDADCGRCGGSGKFGPKVVEGGRCFQCRGHRRLTTRNGQRAFDAYLALMQERMGVPAEEITEGSRVFADASAVTTPGPGGGSPVVYFPWAWRTVRTVSARTDTHTVHHGEEAEEVTRRSVSLGFGGGKTYQRSTTDGEPITFIVPAPEVEEKIMREVAKRYKGAWLDGEEPPAPAKPRLRKSADMTPKAKPEPRTFPNRFPGTCVRPGCGQDVAANTGECFRDGGQYVTQHKAGECPPPAEETQAEPVTPAAEETPAPAMVNKYTGECAYCGVLVEAEQGERLRVEGEWRTRHPKGTCPPPPGPAADGTPGVLITRSKLYPEVARPGPAWRWSYEYTVNGAPAITYGPGLSSLRDILRRKYGTPGVEAWKPQGPAQEPPAPAPKVYTHTSPTYGENGGYVEKTFEVTGPLYHGGGVRLREGDSIRPGRRTNTWGDERGTSTRVYFTTRLDVAVAYAEQSGGHVFEVEPTGEFSFDRSDEYKTVHPLTVVRKLTREEWHPAPAAEETPAEPATEEGIYRRRGTLYRVRRGPSGHLYAHTITWHEDAKKVTFAKAPGVARRLLVSERLPLAEAEEISARWDVCMLCGAEMTVSKGIGPDCRKRV